MTSGSGINTTNGYNSRLQPVTVSASATAGGGTIFSLTYDFHSGNGDNGNVYQILNNLDSTRSAVFTYDALNRLQQANTITTTGANCWGEVYTIDAWSNLTNRAAPAGMSGCLTEALNAPASVSNQLSGQTYDRAGNTLYDSLNNALTYDAENRIIGDAGLSYRYDADGNRVEKCVAGSTPGTCAIGGTVRPGSNKDQFAAYHEAWDLIRSAAQPNPPVPECSACAYAKPDSEGAAAVSGT